MRGNQLDEIVVEKKASTPIKVTTTPLSHHRKHDTDETTSFKTHASPEPLDQPGCRRAWRAVRHLPSSLNIAAVLFSLLSRDPLPKLTALLRPGRGADIFPMAFERGARY